MIPFQLLPSFIALVTTAYALPQSVPNSGKTGPFNTTSYIPMATTVREGLDGIKSGVATTTIWSDGYAYTITQFSELGLLSSIALTTIMSNNVVTTVPVTVPKDGEEATTTPDPSSWSSVPTVQTQSTFAA